MDVLEMQLADAAEFLEMGHFEKAIRICDRILEDNPQAVEALRMRGVALYHSGESAAALADFQALLAIESTYAEAWVYRAFCERQLDQVEEAIHSAEQAHEIDPDLLDAMELLLILHAKAGRTAEVDAYAEKIQALEPDNGTVRFHRGGLAYRRGDFQRALEDFLTLHKQQQALGYQTPEIMNRIAMSYLAEGDAQRAVPFLRQSLEEDTYNGRTLRYVGYALVKLGEEEGLTYLNKAVKYESEDPLNYFFRGHAMQMLEDPEGAAEDFQYAQSLNIDVSSEEDLDHLLVKYLKLELPELGADVASDDLA